MATALSLLCTWNGRDHFLFREMEDTRSSSFLVPRPPGILSPSFLLTTLLPLRVRAPNISSFPLLPPVNPPSSLLCHGRMFARDLLIFFCCFLSPSPFPPAEHMSRAADPIFHLKECYGGFPYFTTRLASSLLFRCAPLIEATVASPLTSRCRLFLPT